MNRLIPLLLGTAIAFAAPSAGAQGAAQGQGEPPTAVYGLPHVEAALETALARHVTVGRLRLEIDNRTRELRVPGGATGSMTVDNIHYSPLNGRFAAELVVPGASQTVRMPVSGRAYGVVEVPVLGRPVRPGDEITPSDITWAEMRADQAGSDIAAQDVQLVGMTPRRGIPVNQPIRLSDVQSPRVVTKGSLVTITLSTPNITISAQGKALQDGGKGDVIRVVNTHSNRVVEATVAGPNLVAVAKPGTAMH